jgi:2-dehydro-3-deoxygalactonokinase
VLAEGGKIASFATYMTGEIYAAARAHTILGRLMQDGEASGASFARGVREGARAGTPGALLHRLFGVRTSGLFGDVSAADLPDYLSGLLIGAEIGDAGRQGGPVHIIASDTLAERYRSAAAELGLTAEIVPSHCVLDGYMGVACLAGLISASVAR